MSEMAKALGRMVETLELVAQRAHEAEAHLHYSGGNPWNHRNPTGSNFDDCRHPLCRRADRAMLRAVKALRAEPPTEGGR